MKHWKVTIDHVGVRLDHFLVEILDYSRSRITTLIKEQHIKVNNQSVKPGFLLHLDDEITLDEPEVESLDLTPVNLDLDIVYEDDDLLVVNKPQGLVVHPASSYKEATLVHGLLHQMDNLSQINGVERPGILHRIDKDTSGLLLVAKSDHAHRVLAKDLSNHEIKRKYYALVYGHFKLKKGRIDAPIGRHPKNRLKNAVVADGRHAVTHFEVIESFEKYSLLSCELQTGRTHQIRVHLSYINHPIVGDPVYGPQPPIGKKGQFLHAYRLSFVHPTTKKTMTFEAPLPESFKSFIDSLS